MKEYVILNFIHRPTLSTKVATSMAADYNLCNINISVWC